jgi:hypothetical protein
MLSSIFSTGRRNAAPPFSGHVIPMKVRGADVAPFDEPVSSESKRRTSIWDMHHSVHCSIIGTCLSGGELRRLLIKLGVQGADSANDHDLHKQAVTLAGRPQGGAKLIQKALDRRHEAAIKRYAKVKDEDGLRTLWEEALRQGEIPGAYWAVLSHPAATDVIMRRVFGDVHMLSHMVGAANRADIRRLRQLEADNEALAAKLESQQRQLRDGFTARDGKIRLLNEALSRALTQAPASAEQAGDDVAAVKDALVDLDGRLRRETARRERIELRMTALTQALADAERARQNAERECENLRGELARLDQQVDGWLTDDPEAKSDAVLPALAGALVLYVGGRAHQVPQLRAMVERAGGSFLYHDGGIEHSVALLPGLISRADCAVFPIDCVSHDAMATVKRHCRQAGKPFLPLRTSSLAGLMSGLASLPQASMAVTIAE